MTMQNLIINDELKTLLPPLSAEEFAGLEADIRTHGCLAPVVAWDGILVDGHHRYEICTKHEIPFSVQNIVFDDLDAAKLWAWKHQENRRNLTPFHRGELALKLKDVIAAKAKERQRAAGGDKSKTTSEALPSISTEARETRQELAEIAGVAPTTLGQIQYIAEHADAETKDKLRQRTKGTSINKEYNRLKAEQKAETSEPDPKHANESTDDEKYPEPPCPNKHVKYFPMTTLKLIPQESPQVLISRLLELFREGFVEEMIVMAMDMLAEEKGKDAVKTILAQLNKKHGKK